MPAALLRSWQLPAGGQGLRVNKINQNLVVLYALVRQLVRVLVVITARRQHHRLFTLVCGRVTDSPRVRSALLQLPLVVLLFLV